MSDDDSWQVVLRFQDQKSNKFWRARCAGNALEVNYGRVGSKGQSQVKRYDSANDCARELEKQANAKRKKGYADDPAATTTPAAEAAEPALEPAAAPATTEAAGEHLDLRLDLGPGERRLELRLSLLDDCSVRTVAVERYPDADAAKAAFEQLRDAVTAEGYRRA